MSIDMNQFKPIFIEESLEAISTIESTLVNQSDAQMDEETLNLLFRMFHSIKGGCGSFGFDALVGFTHNLETLLDEMREGNVTPNDHHIQILLKVTDFLQNTFLLLKDDNDYKIELDDALVTEVDSMVAESKKEKLAKEKIENINKQKNAVKAKWKIIFVPGSHLFTTGNDPLMILKDLADNGESKVTAKFNDLPKLKKIDVTSCYMSWEIEFVTTLTKNEIEDIFAWVIFDVDKLEVEQLEVLEENKAAIENQAAEATESTEVTKENANQSVNEPTKDTNTDNKEEKKATKSLESQATNTSPGIDTSTVRVSTKKIDSILNIASEIVITQSVLMNAVHSIDPQVASELNNALRMLDQNAKELQKSVMDIRMLPISIVFNRLQRIVFDLSRNLNKKINLVVSGENTEIDKTILEKIIDPLVHIIRNSLDHGIESTEDRLKAGKSEVGVIELNASHYSGDICIEIVDDGKGINPEIIKNKAIEKGLINPQDNLMEKDILELIFHPGFSTAEKLSNISGRGVGMEVVKKNIESLNGRISISSQVGHGTTMTILLPLTLAILEVQLLNVNSQTYIVPITSIIETAVIEQDKVRTIGEHSRFYLLRNQYIPLLTLGDVFDYEDNYSSINNKLILIVEHKQSLIGILIDELLAQQQIVIKSLEDNYHKIDGIAAATILGNGSVCFILDLERMYSLAQNKYRLMREEKYLSQASKNV